MFLVPSLSLKEKPSPTGIRPGQQSRLLSPRFFDGNNDRLIEKPRGQTSDPCKCILGTIWYLEDFILVAYC